MVKHVGEIGECGQQYRSATQSVTLLQPRFEPQFMSQVAAAVDVRLLRPLQ